MFRLFVQGRSASVWGFDTNCAEFHCNRRRERSWESNTVAESSATGNLAANRLRGHVPHKDLANNVMDQNETSGQLPEATSTGRALYVNLMPDSRTFRWRVIGYGYELTGIDVLDAFNHYMAAAQTIGIASQARADVLAMARKQPGPASDILIRQCSVVPQEREAPARAITTEQGT